MTLLHPSRPLPRFSYGFGHAGRPRRTVPIVIAHGGSFPERIIPTPARQWGADRSDVRVVRGMPLPESHWHCKVTGKSQESGIRSQGSGVRGEEAFCSVGAAENFSQRFIAGNGSGRFTLALEGRLSRRRSLSESPRSADCPSSVLDREKGHQSNSALCQSSSSPARLNSSESSRWALRTTTAALSSSSCVAARMQRLSLRPKTWTSRRAKVTVLPSLLIRT